MIKIDILNNDLIIGNFRSSDYGLIIGSFSNGESEDDIGMKTSTIEEFIGHNPVPVYLGQKYTDKLKLQITLIKNPCMFYDKIYFNEKECRAILRILTGLKGYQWLKLAAQALDDDLWYKVRINSVTYKRVGGHVVGILLEAECDSCYAWSKEYNITVNAKANQHFYIYNYTDDLNNYVYPITSIISSSAVDIKLTNLSDNNWTTVIKCIQAQEKITIDSGHQIISSNLPHELLLDNFNLRWIRLVPEKNEYLCNTDISIVMKFRVPRKVGIICEQDAANQVNFMQVPRYCSSQQAYCNDLVPITAQEIDSLF